MSFLSKFGFTYRERILISILLCALLAGILISTIRHNIAYTESGKLTLEDSIAVNELGAITARAASGVDTLVSQDEDIIAAPSFHPIDINTADAGLLEQLPGIGPKLAARIIEHREKYGLFESIESLTDVEGIGEKRLDKIRNLITLSIP